MKSVWIALAAAALLAAPAHADGDAAAGERVFNQCQACHVVEDPDGNVLAGRNARTGPNLYDMHGNQAGTRDGFRYGAALVEAGENGLVWDEEAFVAYVLDPVGFLRATLDNNRARSNMSFRLRSEQDARNLYAYITSLGTDDEG